MTNFTVSSTASNSDIGQRLQQKIAVWRGAERGQTVQDLHEECRTTVGLGGYQLLPVRVLQVDDLNTHTLQQALQRFNGKYQQPKVQFRVQPVGHFDMALVPVGLGGILPDRWLLFLESDLSVQDQVALYAHAVGHLLLNRELTKLDKMPLLDPRDGRSHADSLGELRLLENTNDPMNRRVLETYPLLAELLRPQEAHMQISAPVGLRERLAEFGWRGHLVTSPYVFTEGRIFVTSEGIRRGRKLREDALLRAETSLPIALVHTLRDGESQDEAKRRLKEYGRDRLCVPFAYLLDDNTVYEFDWTESNTAVQSELKVIPSREMLLSRWTQSLGLFDEDLKTLQYPYRTSLHTPRYYQEAAINRAVIAVLQARHGLRDPRILINLATGTGKTHVAFQIVWKLKKTRAVRNVLFITDRDYLLSQAMDNHFAPFGEARKRILGEKRTAHDVLFATYQALAGDAERSGIYLDYPQNFFDLIIIDECHRGGASDESNWRRILEYFDSAIQIGMTATPLRSDNVKTYEYFKDAVAVYSLRRGINDGFLAPYRVLRVRLGEEVEEESVTAADTSTENATADGNEGGNDTEAEFKMLPSKVLVDATDTIAKHLVGHLRSTDPMAKTIVFCVDQDHAEQMRLAIKRECEDIVSHCKGYTARIVSEESGAGKRALGKFSTPEEPTPVVVTTSRLLTTGVDVPTCKNIVIARPVGSFVEFKQIIGRGTRLHEPQKTWFTIIDYAGAIKHFFDPDFDGDPEAVEVEVLKPKLPEEEQDIPVDAVVTSEKKDEEPSEVVVAEPAGQPEEEICEIGGIEQPQEEIPQEEQPLEAVLEEQEEPEEPETPQTDEVGTSEEIPVVVEEPSDEAEDEEQIAQVKGGGRTRPKDDVRIVVVGEMLYELGPDGRAIRKVNYEKYAKKALDGIAANSSGFKQRWLRREQREEIQGILLEEGIDISELAKSLGTPDADPLDLLVHVVYGEPLRTRHVRAEKLRKDHEEFFNRYGEKAQEVLKAILSKYEAGETDSVNDPELLKVPPASDLGRPVELIKEFGGGDNMRTALRDMEVLLYSD